MPEDCTREEGRQKEININVVFDGRTAYLVRTLPIIDKTHIILEQNRRDASREILPVKGNRAEKATGNVVSKATSRTGLGVKQSSHSSGEVRTRSLVLSYTNLCSCKLARMTRANDVRRVKEDLAVWLNKDHRNSMSGSAKVIYTLDISSVRAKS